MRIFYQYLKDYFRLIQPKQFLLTGLFIAVLIFLNYQMGIEKNIKAIPRWYIGLFVFYIFYLFVFGMAYLIQFTGRKQKARAPVPAPVAGPGADSRGVKKKFLVLLFLAPLLFSLKMIHWNIFFTSDGQVGIWERYASLVAQLPLKLIMLIIVLVFLKRYLQDEKSFWGLSTKHFSPKPYLLVLICMVPLIALASTQADFLHVYPKLKAISFIESRGGPVWPWQLLYEISYGMDFVAIELFFRGFLVIGFMRFAGIDSILPMAAFYCTIHFGKPVAECISSFFGGLILGVIVYRTRSIFGGLLVHLGIAYLMEIGGYIGQLYH